jgi:hypothetical protein
MRAVSQNANNRLCRAVMIGTILVILGHASSTMAQSSRIDGGVVSQDKFGFYWETRLEPPTPPPANNFATATAYGPGVVHRLLMDRSRSAYVGYDALVVPLAEPNTYRVTFQQLQLTPELSKYLIGPDASSWSSLTISTPGWGFPAPKTIRGGEVLELSLLMNSTTSQRVVDYITVQEPSRRFSGFDPIPERQFSFAPGQPRDFRASDVELTIQSPRLSINGKLDESTSRRFDAMSGSVVWFYASQRGRFILSLLPHPDLGFRKAGEVRGSSLSFTIGGDTFTLNTGGRIAPGQAPFNLYVRHDPAWRPTYQDADLSAFIMGSSDSAESLVRK